MCSGNHCYLLGDICFLPLVPTPSVLGSNHAGKKHQEKSSAMHLFHAHLLPSIYYNEWYRFVMAHIIHVAGSSYMVWETKGPSTAGLGTKHWTWSYTCMTPRLMLSVLVRISVAWIKHHGQSEGRERVYFSLQFPDPTLSLRDTRTETWRWAMKQMPWRGVTGFLSLFLIELRTTWITHNEIGLTTSIINPENVPQACLRDQFSGGLSLLKFQLQNDTSLCQV